MISLQWWKWKLLTLGTRPTVLLITVLLLIDFFRSKPDPGCYLLDLSPTHNTVILIFLTEFLEENVWFSEQRCLCMKQIRTQINPTVIGWVFQWDFNRSFLLSILISNQFENMHSVLLHCICAYRPQELLLFWNNIEGPCYFVQHT